VQMFSLSAIAVRVGAGLSANILAF